MQLKGNNLALNKNMFMNNQKNNPFIKGTVVVGDSKFKIGEKVSVKASIKTKETEKVSGLKKESLKIEEKIKNQELDRCNEECLEKVENLSFETGDMILEEIDRVEFEKFKEDLKDVVDKKDLDKLDSLRKKAIEFEKNGDIEAADKTWDNFDKILDKYEFEDEELFEEGEELEFNVLKTNKSLSKKVSKNLTELKKQFELLRILSKDNALESKQYKEKISYIKKLEKKGLESVDTKELVRFLEKTNEEVGKKLIDMDELENDSLQKIDGNFNYNKNMLIDVYA